jgi:hypothetical protein
MGAEIIIVLFLIMDQSNAGTEDGMEMEQPLQAIAPFMLA